MSLLSENKARVILVSLLLTYILIWIIGNRGMLFDPMLQNDDVRTHIFAFHQYSDNSAFKTDPIAKEVMNMMTPGVEALYRLVVPLTNVPVATKVIQALCFIIILIPLFIVPRNKYAIFPMIVLLIFFVLHTPSLVERIVGGLQRSFAIPCIIIWISGALLSRRSIRIVAILIAGLTYPIIMGLLMVSELLFILVQIDWKCTGVVYPRLLLEMKFFLLLIFLCGLVLVPYMIHKRNAGPVTSLIEAQNEPAFGQEGRVQALPFPNPFPEAIAAFMSPINFHGGILALFKPLPNYIRFKFIINLFVFIMSFFVVSFLVWKKVIPVPKVALCLIFASIIMYALSRVFAFHLYWPKRYLQLGLPLAFITGIAEIVCQIKIYRFSLSSFWLAIFVIIISITFLGDGIEPRIGMTIDGRLNHQLFEFFQKTPLNTKILCHPYDGDDVPYWSGRPTTGGYETLQPWFIESWQRHKYFTEEVLRALYATKWSTVISFCHKYNITYIMINTDRYGPDFREKANMFEPFGSFLEALLSSINQNDLVITRVLQTNPVFYDKPFFVIDVNSLLSFANDNINKNDSSFLINDIGQ
jgi:hypothetical protein